MSSSTIPPEVMADLIDGADDAHDLAWALLVTRPDAAELWDHAVRQREAMDAHARLTRRYPWLARVFLRTRQARRRMAAVSVQLPDVAMALEPVPSMGMLSGQPRGSQTIVVDWMQPELPVDVKVGDVLRIASSDVASVWYHTSDGKEYLLDEPWRVEPNDGAIVLFTIVAGELEQGASLADTLAQGHATTNVILFVRNPENEGY